MNYGWAKIIVAGLLLSGCSKYAVAQDETDALRYSQLQTQGTARSIGIGGALGSVGGDFSTLSVNPAGIGIYRRSEITISPSLMFNNVNGTYLGNTQSENGSHFAIGNVGIVWSKAEKGKRYQRSQWKAVSFGLGFNRTADFTHNYTYQGNNSNSSASWVFESDANNPQNPFSPYTSAYGSATRPADLGYQTHLLDSSGLNANGSPFYQSIVSPSGANPVSQRTSVAQHGGISEATISLGGNYKEKLMIGGTVGIPIVNFISDRSLVETNVNGIGDFSSFTYNQHLSTSGMGANFKLGLIYRVNDYFRVGAAVHTPTHYWFTDESSTDVTSVTKTYGTTTSGTAQQQYDYSLNTPWRAIASATAILGTFGFFTVDYEYVDYRTMSYSLPVADKDYQVLINDVIKNTYSGTSNLRTGLEVKLSKLFMVRGGFGYSSNPYKSSVYNDGEHLDYSCGIGLRLHNYFADLGFVHHQYKDTEQTYNTGYSNVLNPSAVLNTGKNNAVFTLGWKF